MKSTEINNSFSNILVYGIGNPGRNDDGLGHEMISRCKQIPLPGIKLHYNYQLSIEDSLLLLEHDLVLFVDASKTAPPPFSFQPACLQKNKLPIYTHLLSIEALLGLTQELYQKIPLAFVLGIRGYQWELQQELSSQGKDNLDHAFTFLLPLLKKTDSLHEIISTSLKENHIKKPQAIVR